MGQLEKKNGVRRRKENLQKIILGTVSTVGVLSISLVAPNVIGAMKKLGILPRLRQKEYVSSSASKLVKRGLLKFKNGYYQLTDNYKLNRPKKWDGKWRMIIFDIPEKKKRVRKQVSTLFNQAGFYRLQDSVWVYPYDCEDIIGLLKTDFGVGKDVLYVIADEIENDHRLRQEFSLNS
jgi:DNA-binding transcriptional regulator PaaX